MTFGDETNMRIGTLVFTLAAMFAGTSSVIASFNDPDSLNGLMCSTMPPVSRIKSTMCFTRRASRSLDGSFFPSQTAMRRTLSMPRTNAEYNAQRLLRSWTLSPSLGKPTWSGW